MTQDLISPILLGMAVGLLLAGVPPRTMWWAAAAFLGAAIVGTFVSLRTTPELSVTALRISAIAAALSVYARQNGRTVASIPLSLISGFVIGSSAGSSGNLAMLALGLASMLIALPARLITHRIMVVARKVVASWIIAIALLSLGVSMVSTPGYRPDHME